MAGEQEERYVLVNVEGVADALLVACAEFEMTVR